MMNIKNVIKRFFLILKKSIDFSPKFFFVRITITLLGVGVSMINIVFPKYLLLALKEKDTTKLFLTVLINASVSFVINSIITFLNPHVSASSEKLNAKVIDEFLNKSISLRLSSFEEKGFYNKYTLIFEKCCEIFQTVNNIFFQAISAITQILVIIYILSWMDKTYLCVLLITVCFQSIIGNLIKKINYEYRVKLVKNSKRLNYLYRLFNIPEFMRDVRINSLFDFILVKKQGISQIIINDTFSAQKDIRKKAFVQNLVSLVETIFITIYLGYMFLKGKIWIDTFVVSQNSYMQLKNALLKILSLYNNLYENDLYVADYIDFLNYENEIVYGNTQLENKVVKAIEFKNVSFSYPNNCKNVLNDVSLKISKGEKVSKFEYNLVPLILKLI